MKHWISVGAGLVTLIFGLFGGALGGARPPLHPLQPDEALVGFGMVELAALLLILILLGALRQWGDRIPRSVWLVVAVSLAAGFSFTASGYLEDRVTRSFVFTPGEEAHRFVQGDDSTEFAREYLRTQGPRSAADLVREVGGLDQVTLIWPEPSINRVHQGFLRTYTLLVLLLSATLVAVCEGVLPTPPAGDQGGGKRDE